MLQLHLLLLLLLLSKVVERLVLILSNDLLRHVLNWCKCAVHWRLLHGHVASRRRLHLHLHWFDNILAIVVVVVVAVVASRWYHHELIVDEYIFGVGDCCCWHMFVCGSYVLEMLVLILCMCLLLMWLLVLMLNVGDDVVVVVVVVVIRHDRLARTIVSVVARQIELFGYVLDNLNVRACVGCRSVHAVVVR